MKVYTNLMILALVLVSCGTMPTSADKAAEDQKKKDMANQYPDGVLFEGYISNAFAITVDSVNYTDSEDFYTKQLDSLTKSAVDSGYAGWKLDFNAQLGLDDLKYGMTVFIAAVNNNGYAAQTVVQENGTFSVNFPANAVDSAYQVRANKHISVSLTDPKDQGNIVHWCYNFSAVNQSVSLSEHDKPIILNNFVTKLTKYDCSTSSTGSITIPVANTQPAQ